MPSIIHWAGSAWHSVRSLAFGSIIASDKPIVCCQNVPPTTVKLPGSTTPMPPSPSARFDNRRKDFRSHPADVDDVAGPGPLSQVEHARAGADRGVGHELTCEPLRDPVGEHVHVLDLLEQLGLVTPDPEQPCRSGDGHPVAAMPVDRLGEAPLDEVGGLGTRP